MALEPSELDRIPRLAGLADADLAALARLGRKLEAPGGQVLVGRERPADGVLLVVRGKAAVLVGGTPVAELGPGGLAGRLGPLRASERAEVVAVSAVTVLCLGDWALRRLIRIAPAAVGRLTAGPAATAARRSAASRDDA